MRTRAAFTLLLSLALAAGNAVAHPQAQPPEDGADEILAPAPTYKANDVKVDEHLGNRVPLDAPFRTSDGKQVVLRDVLSGGELPTILTFNYSDCPMLCSLQLNGLVNAIPLVAGDTKTVLRLGVQYRIVTIDLEPNEPVEKLAKMRERYLERLPVDERDAARAGWTFLAASNPGVDAQIHQVAEAVGFKYTYIPERSEWAHPAALIFLSSAGVVTRYVYGIEFDTQVMRESLLKAGQAEPATAVGFMNRCYHYDPDANSHAHAGVMALRIGAAGFLVLLISAFGLMHFLKRHRRNGVSS